MLAASALLHLLLRRAGLSAVDEKQRTSVAESVMGACRAAFNVVAAGAEDASVRAGGVRGIGEGLRRDAARVCPPQVLTRSSTAHGLPTPLSSKPPNPST